MISRVIFRDILLIFISAALCRWSTYSRRQLHGVLCYRRSSEDGCFGLKLGCMSLSSPSGVCFCSTDVLLMMHSSWKFKLDLHLISLCGCKRYRGILCVRNPVYYVSVTGSNSVYVTAATYCGKQTFTFTDAQMKHLTFPLLLPSSFLCLIAGVFIIRRVVIQ